MTDRPRPVSFLGRALARLVPNPAATRAALSDLARDVRAVRSEIRSVRQELHDRLLQYHLQLGRLSRLAEGREETPVGLSRPLSIELGVEPEAAWEPVGDGSTPPDPEGREWLLLDRCAVCDSPDYTIVNEWNKLLLLEKAPDVSAVRYDYAVCHGCGVLFATRRPHGARYRYLLEHFGEVSGKRGGAAEIPNPLLNPYPLSDSDRDALKRLLTRGVFVSDHLGLKASEYMRGLLNDRFENAVHLDVISSLLPLAGARVLEVRSRAGTILDGLRRIFGAQVMAMPIWESQRFILAEAYGIEASACIDFDHFSIPFDEPFDLIVCNHMLTHAIRPREFFATLHRHLEPGGHIYLHNEPDDEDLLVGRQSIVAHLNPLHMQAFDQRSLVRALAANGFEVVFLKARGDLKHMCLARKVAAHLEPMPKVERKKRVTAYQNARDRAILRVPRDFQGRVAAVWSETVARAVASGEAQFDEGGQLRLVARGPGPKVAGEHRDDEHEP